jgi:hypothetical protein
MLYVVPVLTISMLAYMAWAVLFRLRRDRVITHRERMRGMSTFRPREKARFLLRKSFPPVEQKADWEEPLVASLTQAAAAAAPHDGSPAETPRPAATVAPAP